MIGIGLWPYSIKVLLGTRLIVRGYFVVRWTQNMQALQVASREVNGRFTGVEGLTGWGFEG